MVVGDNNLRPTRRSVALLGDERAVVPRPAVEPSVGPESKHYKFEYGLWTLSLISELIHRQFTTKLALSTVSRIMKNLGFTVQKPLYQAWQQDPVLVKTWETETYPAIRKEAKAAGATIYFADEAGIRSDYHSGTTWAPKGRTPVVNVTGRRLSLNMISAVSPRGEFRFMVHDGPVNAGVFLMFLKRLMTGATSPIFLIVDGHPIHKAAKVKRFVESTNGMLKLFFSSPVFAPPESGRGCLSACKARRREEGRGEQGRDESTGTERAAADAEAA